MLAFTEQNLTHFFPNDESEEGIKVTVDGVTNPIPVCYSDESIALLQNLQVADDDTLK